MPGLGRHFSPACNRISFTPSSIVSDYALGIHNLPNYSSITIQRCHLRLLFRSLFSCSASTKKYRTVRLGYFVQYVQTSASDGVGRFKIFSFSYNFSVSAKRYTRQSVHRLTRVCTSLAEGKKSIKIRTRDLSSQSSSFDDDVPTPLNTTQKTNTV